MSTQAKRALDRLLDRAQRSLESGQERREHDRRPFVKEVLVQPLSEEFCPDLPNSWAVTQDIATGGIGLRLMHNKPVSAPFLALVFDQDVMLVETVRCHRVHGTYEVGCRILFSFKQSDPRFAGDEYTRYRRMVNYLMRGQPALTSLE